MFRIDVRPLLMCASLLAAGCDTGAAVSPVLFEALALQGPARGAAAVPPLAGRWTGSSVVEGSSGALPSCIPEYWQVGYAELVTAQVVPVTGTKTFNLHIRHETAGELCELELTPVKDGIFAQPFDDKGSGAEGEHWCHFRTDTTTWKCPGGPPDVWLLGMKISAGFTDEAQSRIRGRLDVGYDHRPGRGTPYNAVVLSKRLDIRKAAP
jgi:hypothetical protein